ncbi:MAG: tetratricopeptide repeat protein, partial [Caldilinea sp.]
MELTRALEGVARFHELAGLHREAVQLFNDALMVIADEPTRAALQIEIARACITLARYDDAIAAGRAALESAQQRNDNEQTAAALLQLGIAANAMGDAAASEKHLLAALPLAQHAEAEALIAEILAAQAAARTYLGGDGGDLLQQALAIYRSLGNRRREGLTLSDLAMIATRAPDWEACARYAAAALEIARDLGERRFESMTLNILAAAYAERGDLAESDRALHRSLHLARAVGYQLGEVNALNSLGLNSLHRQECAAARDYFEQALTIARRTNYRRGVGALLSNLGVIAAQNEEYARAEQFQREALEIARAAEDHYFTVVRLDSLGDVRRWQGDYAGAFACFVEAAELAERIGNASLEAHARTDIGLLARFFGDDACSERELNRGLALARKMQDIECECRAEAALAWNSFAIHNDPKSLAALEAVSKRARAAGSAAAEAHTLTALGAALLESGAFDDALATLERAVALHRDLPGALMLLTPLAFLADLHRRRDDTTAAMQRVEEILHILDNRIVGGVDDPLAVYVTVAQALDSVHDPRRGAFIQRGCTHLLAQADAFPSLHLR